MLIFSLGKFISCKSYNFFNFDSFCFTVFLSSFIAPGISEKINSEVDPFSFSFEVEPTNSDRVIGKVGEVTQKIGRNKYGEVKVYGNTWTASSKQVINVGERVKVLSIDGVKLVVEKEKK